MRLFTACFLAFALVGCAGSTPFSGARADRNLCTSLRVLRGQVARAYQVCCEQDELSRPACIALVGSNCERSLGLRLAAVMADSTRNADLLAEILKGERNIWGPTLLETPRGVENAWPLLGQRDWVIMDFTIRRSGTRSGTNARRYVLSRTASASVRFAGETTATWDVSGCMSVMPVDTGTTGLVGLPTEIDLHATYFGQTLILTLDKTSPFNTLTTDAQGHGTLGLALTLDSKSPGLAGNIYVGGTFYFKFPVDVALDWSSIRLHADQTMPGNTITPCDPVALKGADTPPHPGVTETPCADNDGNGIRDGADEAIYAMMSQLNCVAQQ